MNLESIIIFILLDDQVLDYHFEVFVSIYQDFPLENIPIED